ncbi:hypothetical protein ACEQ8H_004528 [Pleosporales sp. CAS-2024a]
MDGPTASAVVLPEESLPPASPSSTSNKRRQSSTTEDSAKRPRLDDPSPKEGRESTNAATSAAPVRRERGRERRLFGAVLGALSQAPSTTAAQKRRAEFEKKQLAQRKQESEESAQRRAAREARRKAQRWKEQRRFDEESLRLRHDSLLNTAHFLRTETTPHLYYKPWETSAEEDDRIRDQIAEARRTISREIQEHEARLEQETDRERRHSGDARGSRSGKEHDTDTPHESLPANGDANGSRKSPIDQDMADNHAEDPGHEAVSVDVTGQAMDSTVAAHETNTNVISNHDDDDNGEDVVEEAAEDTVIY